MIESSKQNKKAWEFNAYDFWLKESGQPAEKAQKILANPARSLRFHASYFSSFQGVKVANICGSCGKKAVALAALGADVTIFDISEVVRIDLDRFRPTKSEKCTTHKSYNIHMFERIN